MYMLGTELKGIPTALVGLIFFHYTHVDEKSKLFSLKINDKTRTVTILT